MKCDSYNITHILLGWCGENYKANKYSFFPCNRKKVTLKKINIKTIKKSKENKKQKGAEPKKISSMLTMRSIQAESTMNGSISNIVSREDIGDDKRLSDYLQFLNLQKIATYF